MHAEGVQWLDKKYPRTLARGEEECGQRPVCSEELRGQGHGAASGSPVQGGDALGPSSTWHGADAADARLRLSAQHPSPCRNMLTMSLTSHVFELHKPVGELAVLSASNSADSTCWREIAKPCMQTHGCMQGLFCALATCNFWFLAGRRRDCTKPRGLLRLAKK